MPKVLVFESDPAFATTVEQGLASYDCEVQIVPDGESGIAAAESSPPDIILLTIELPRMNGFSVCNKLKRNASLKGIPLVLMSSEATSDTFEQHKRLRTRAEEYVHKPIEFSDLITKIQALVALEKADEVIIDDDELVIEDVEAVSELAPEVDVEADEAFGNLIASTEAREAEERRAAAYDAPVEEAVIEEVAVEEELEIADDSPAPLASAPPPEPLRTSVPPRRSSIPASSTPPIDPALLRAKERELAEARGQLLQLESEVKLARAEVESEQASRLQLEQKKDAESAILQKEIDELREKVEKNAGAGTAREFLDLREQLNKKDKEIIEVRDLLTSREKEVVRLNDTNIASEREKADQGDQIRELELRISGLEKTNTALGQDKAQAEKRGDDFKLKSERLSEQLEARTTELTQARDQHEHELARRDAVEATAREDHRQELEQSAIDAEAALQSAVKRAVDETQQAAAVAQEAALTRAAAEAQETQDVALLAREKELRDQHDGRMAALHRANEDGMRKLRAEHEQALAAAEEAATERLSAREAELAREREDAVASQKARDDELFAQLQAEKAEGESERDARILNLETTLAAREGELTQANQTIEERDGRVAQLEADLAATRADLSEARDSHANAENLLAQARAKWAEDAAALNEARERIGEIGRSLEGVFGRAMV